MREIQNAVITAIHECFTVFSPKGRVGKIENRKNYGLSLCYEGQITYRQEGKTVVSDHACAVFLPQGQTYTLHGDKTGRFPVINFSAQNFDCRAPFAVPLSDPEPFLGDFEQLQSLALFDGNRLKSIGIFYRLLHRLCTQNTVSPLLAPAVRHLEKNYGDPTLSNAFLASICGISEVYFRKAFAAQFGMTPHRYIVDIRIEKAKQLLSEGNRKIGAVAESCGFSEPYHFCRVFKEKCGMTPSEYRERNRVTTI